MEAWLPGFLILEHLVPNWWRSLGIVTFMSLGVKAVGHWGWLFLSGMTLVLCRVLSASWSTKTEPATLRATSVTDGMYFQTLFRPFESQFSRVMWPENLFWQPPQWQLPPVAASCGIFSDYFLSVKEVSYLQGMELSFQHCLALAALKKFYLIGFSSNLGSHNLVFGFVTQWSQKKQPWTLEPRGKV